MNSDTIEILAGGFSALLIVGLLIAIILAVSQCNSNLKEAIKNSASAYECIEGQLYEHIKDYKGNLIKKQIHVKCKK